jgi:hypothetical protein
MNPVGLKDDYDFNWQQWGNRSTEAETVTRMISVYGCMCGASSYQIYYGIHN